MRFLVSRTSQIYNPENDPPCEGAMPGRYTITEVRSVASFQEFDAKYGPSEGLWQSRGVNHRIIDGCVARDHPDKASGWFVEIPDLESLVRFAGEHGGNLVLAVRNSEPPSVEIYDDYRE